MSILIMIIIRHYQELSQSWLAAIFAKQYKTDYQSMYKVWLVTKQYAKQLSAKQVYETGP